MVARFYLAATAAVALICPHSALAQDNRLSTNCRLTPYSYPCLGYDMETSKRMVAEDDERRANELRKNSQEHDAKVQAERKKREQAEIEEKRRREQVIAEERKRKHDQKAWSDSAQKKMSDGLLPVELPPATRWVAKAEVSKFDDTVGINAVLRASEEIIVRSKRVTPIILARCKEGATAIFIDWGVYVSTSNTVVEYRIDKERAEQKTWLISTDHQATGLTGSSAIQILKKFSQGKSFLVRVTPYGESPVAATFELTGAAEVVTNLRRACAW